MVRATEQPDEAADGIGNGLLSPRQEAVALALAGGCTHEEASERTGAGTRTIRTWTATVPAFNRRVSELRAEMTARALGRMLDGMAFAASTLRSLLKAKSETVRLGAARAVLELGVKLRDSVEIEARIAALEQTRATPVRRVG